MSDSRKRPPRPSGFEETPQAPFEGAPLTGDITDWVAQIEREAEQSARRESTREIRSQAGKHRLKAERAAQAEAQGGAALPGGSETAPGGKGSGAKRGKGASSRDGEGKPAKQDRIYTVGSKRTGGGASIGGSNDPRERAAPGLMPVAGLDVTLEEATELATTAGVTATVAALKALIESGNPLHKNGQMWVPHRPERPEKSEGGIPLKMVTEFEPAGDQPTAIRDLVEGLGGGIFLPPPGGGVREADGGGSFGVAPHPRPAAGPSPEGEGNAAERTQVLLGVTGSGKTFTMAKVIEETQRPALILAPNKTLAAQLYGEFRKFFPDNAVEYFVSYYDYYQPEAYVPRTDTYIEKESSVNEQIDRMRHSATRALLERDDVIIVASVSCIYGIGSVETYTAMTFQMSVGDRIDQRQLLADLVAQQYKRQDINFVRGSFRVRGDTVEIFPAHLEDRAWRIALFGDEIESIDEFDPLTAHRTAALQSVKVYANSHYGTPKPTL
ncbi:MAG TPA: DEAD/DEAH box helicase family protein, partial [Rhizobiaceae bacterium]|nr:DEAD/DEAH box helicase family protein [Rhizobiaceae bacterium]